ncbi:DNA polymerase III, chi subunit [Burkholderiales bacterium JOSHI_001]|nr:DNA polymerase III, chi subunit [Burkholderiales bacterium JOSHI_001]
MTEVAFHTGVADPLDYACRLLRKAWRQGARAVVTGAPEQLARLDVQLWTFDPGEFIPHARLRVGQQPAPELLRTPIWLADAGAAAPAAPVLVNLGPDGPDDIQRYERVIEIVGPDDEPRRAARQRWRQYEAAGHQVVHHAKA